MSIRPGVNADMGWPSHRPGSGRPIAIAILLLIAGPVALLMMAALDALLTDGATAAVGAIPAKYVVAGTAMAVGAAAAIVAAGTFERGLFLLFVISIPVRAVLRLGDIPAEVDFRLGQWTGSGNPAWMGYPLGQLSIALSDVPLAMLWLLALPGLVRRPRAFPWWVLSGAALFVVAEVISVTAASQPALAWWAVVETAKAVAGATYVVYRTRSRREFIYCLNAVSMALVLQACVAVGQFLTSSTLGVTFSGVQFPQTLEGSAYVRASGTFPHPQMLAMYAGVFFPLLLATALSSQAILVRVGRTIAVLAASAALALTFSRVGWLAGGVAAGLVVMTTSVGKRHARQIVRAVAVLGVVVAATAPLWATIARNLVLERAGSELDIIADLYRVAFNVIQAHPLNGVGLNNFSFVMLRYDDAGIGMFYPAPVHNLFVLALAEMGPLGLAGLTAVMAIPAVGLWRARQGLDHEGRSMAVGLLGGLVVLSMLSVTGWTYYTIQSPVWLFFGMALAAAGGGLADRDIISGARPRQRT